MLPGTWSVLIDGSGSAVVLPQAVGQAAARGSSPALGCRPCGDHLLPRAVGWGEAEGEGGLYSPAPHPSPPALRSSRLLFKCEEE